LPVVWRRAAPRGHRSRASGRAGLLQRLRAGWRRGHHAGALSRLRRLLQRRRSGIARARELSAHAGRSGGSSAGLDRPRSRPAVIVVLALLLAESVDLQTLSSIAFARPPRVQAARTRADGNAATVALEQPSPFPSLRAGARVWPLGSDSFPNASDQARYR